MEIVSFLQALPDAIFSQAFFMVCVLTFFLCEALFTIPALKKLSWGKAGISLVVGGLLGATVWAMTADALFLGVIAGGVTTLSVARLDRWLKKKK